MNVKAKKHLGQHFLKDESVAKRIADALSWNDYKTALEIGPGMGVLTKYLLNDDKNMSVVEIDTESVEYLKNNYSDKELTIYSEDFLKMDLKSKFSEPFAVIGNFPYNISSQILFKVLENKEDIPELVGMFQKEVAERAAAKEGSKTYGILSVLIQAFYKVEYLFTVNEEVFNPPPKVKSGVIRMQRFRNELEVNEGFFFKVVKAAFNQRRKKLRNAIASVVDKSLLEDEIFSKRAEQLSVEQFIEITKKLS